MKSPLLLIAGLLMGSSFVSAQDCYFPDGSVSTDVPCNSTATASGCCSSDAYCLSNGLCMSDGKLNRGSCTDKGWKSPSCPQYCTKDNIEGEDAIMPCTNTTFTCGYYPGNCSVESFVFSITDADSIVLKATQLTSAMQAAGIATENLEPGSSPTTISVVTVTAPAVPPPNTEFTVAQVIGVGAGVGVPLLIVVGVLSYLLVHEKRTNRIAEIDPFMPLHAPDAREANSWSLWTDSSKTRTEHGTQNVQELQNRPRAELASSP